MKLLLITLPMLLAAIQDDNPWRLVFQSGGKMHSAKEDGTDIRAESAGAPPRGGLSPDGKTRVFVVSLDGGSAICISDPHGRNLKSLTTDKFLNFSPSWTSDGKRIVFSSNRTGKAQVWIMEADGTYPRQLTDHPGGAGLPAASPAGNLIAYVELLPEQSKLPPSTLRTMDLDGRDPKVLIEKTQMLGHAWSPKGDRLACSLVNELRILEMPSAKTVRSFTLNEINKQLHAHAAFGMLWRPDGAAIACTITFLGGRMLGTKVYGDEQIFVLPFEGKPVAIEMKGPAGPVRWEREKK